MDDKVMITTSSGYCCEIDADAMDDFELFEDFVAMEDPSLPAVEQLQATHRAFKRMLGEEQHDAFKEHLKGLYGKVKMSAYHKELNEIFAKFRGSKKN